MASRGGTSILNSYRVFISGAPPDDKMFTKIQKYEEQYRYKIKQERKNKKAWPVSVLLLLYTHLGYMTRAFLKKTRYKIEYKRDLVAKKLEISKLHKEES